MARRRLSTARRAAPGSARVQAAIRGQQRRIAAAIATLDAAAVADVHDARVAARRLRSLLKTFRPLLARRRVRLYRADLRSFARTLGSVREADVRRELLVSLAREDEGLRPADRRRLAVLLDDGCIAAREQLRRHTAGHDWQALCRTLRRRAADRALLSVPGAELGEVVTLVARAWRRPVRLLRRRPRDAAELHQLRLAFKHCRYALESVADVEPEAARRLLRRLRSAQDCIGEHRDTLLAEYWVREHERALGRPVVRRLAEDLRRRERLLRRQSGVRAAKVLDAWSDWHGANRRVRQGASRDRR